MTTLPKWNDERTAQLNELVGGESPITKATVARVAEEMGTSTRSVASKLRKLGHEVERAGEAPRAFSDDQAEELREFVEDHRGELTYGQIAEQFGEGNFTAKQIQGKILSMELTDAVAPTPKAESQKTYSDEEEARVVEMVRAGNPVEDIAAALGRSVPSIRGKALSLLRAGQIDSMPQQREVKGQAPDALEALGDVSGLTVAEIAEQLGKTERGVKTMLTRRGVTCSDYDGAARREKAQAAANA
jgi:DNA-binding CsgD family transcriptional regulator